MTDKNNSFQSIVFKLQKFWSDYGCAIIPGIDMEVGAGTLHHMTLLRALGRNNWNIVSTQSCRRPSDSRYGKNPNRVGFFHQMQVILKPAPENVQDLYLKSLEIIGIDTKQNDIRFIEDDWENPSVGATGLGWEVWCNGLEVSQFTYMQKVGGINCEVIPTELTYGLERLVMKIQGVDSFWEINWNGEEGEKKLTYRDLFLQAEKEQSEYILEKSNTEELFRQFNSAEQESARLTSFNIIIPAYEQAIKASHYLNLLDARNVISSTERASYIGRVRKLVKECCEKMMEE